MLYHPLRLRLLNAVTAGRVEWSTGTTVHTDGWSEGTYTADGATVSGRRGYLRDPHQIRQLDAMRKADLVRLRPWRPGLGGRLLLSPAGAALRRQWLAEHPEVTESVIATPWWVERHRKEVRLRYA